jgi:CelD/BcsL family acetyltransferase involved in cellulose biosynthesis
VSLPFTDCCQPLAVSAERLRELVAALEDAVERRLLPPLEVRAELAGEAVSTSSDAVRHTLELAPDPDAVFGLLKRSQVQRNIRRALESGLSVRSHDEQPQAGDVFYRLHLATHRRLGVPVQPRRFFQLLWEEMLENDLGFALLVYAGDVPVAGGVFLTSKATITYKFGASLAEYWHLRPNYVLFWHAIRSACERGYTVFDFGRSDLENRGLRTFKDGWGTTERRLSYSYIGAPSRGITHAATRAMAPVIQRAPLWVTRVLGELFYKFAA